MKVLKLNLGTMTSHTQSEFQKILKSPLIVKLDCKNHTFTITQSQSFTRD